MTFAEQLKSQLDIVDVIGGYLRLKRSGAAHRYVGLCPFHSEKTPSFSVNAANQFYYCFGCQATGDVFKFVQEIDGLDFPEALKSLAERYGIAMPQRPRSDDPEAQRREALLEMHELAAAQFQNNLRAAGGAETRQYLASRGVARPTVDEFRIGLADTSGQQLVSHLKRFGAELMELSGLVKRRENGGFYDAFRGRLMFPIHNEGGKVIAFGGRALRPDDVPKYLNSPATAIYNKSAVLYNMHRAKADARKHDRIILVEGYMDAIGIYAAGVHEVVAVCGTKLSNDQIRSIKRQIAQAQAHTGQVIFNFDPDAAGANSAEKYIASVLAEGLRVRVLQLPDDLDPDEFIQKHGADAYRDCLEKATTYFHWLAERTRERFDMETVEGRVDAFKAMLPSIQQVSDRLERSALIGELSQHFRLERDMISQQLRQTQSTQAATARPVSPTASVPPNELLLLTCILFSHEAREAIKHYLSGSTVLPALETREIFETVLALDRENHPFSVDAVASRLNPRQQRLIADLSFTSLAIAEDAAPQQALHCLRALEEKTLDLKGRDLRRRIRELEQQGNVQAALGLMTELDLLKKRAFGA